jgi:hypothetical protein
MGERLAESDIPENKKYMYRHQEKARRDQILTDHEQANNKAWPSQTDP